MAGDPGAGNNQSSDKSPRQGWAQEEIPNTGKRHKLQLHLNSKCPASNEKPELDRHSKITTLVIKVESEKAGTLEKFSPPRTGCSHTATIYFCSGWTETLWMEPPTNTCTPVFTAHPGRTEARELLLLWSLWTAGNFHHTEVVRLIHTRH